MLVFAQEMQLMAKNSLVDAVKNSGLLNNMSAARRAAPSSNNGGFADIFSSPGTFLVNATIGTPEQDPITTLVDTGAFSTFFYSADAITQVSGETVPYNGESPFDPSASSTFVNLGDDIFSEFTIGVFFGRLAQDTIRLGTAVLEATKFSLVYLLPNRFKNVPFDGIIALSPKNETSQVPFPLDYFEGQNIKKRNQYIDLNAKETDSGAINMDGGVLSISASKRSSYLRAPRLIRGMKLLDFRFLEFPEQTANTQWRTKTLSYVQDGVIKRVPETDCIVDSGSAPTVLDSEIVQAIRTQWNLTAFGPFSSGDCDKRDNLKPFALGISTKGDIEVPILLEAKAFSYEIDPENMPNFCFYAIGERESSPYFTNADFRRTF